MNTSQYKGDNKGRPTFAGNASIEEVINSFKSLLYIPLADYIKSKTGIAISKKMIVKLGRNLKSLNYKFRTYQGTTQYKVKLKDLGGEGGEK